jgi:hypothetical protein
MQLPQKENNDDLAMVRCLSAIRLTEMTEFLVVNLTGLEFAFFTVYTRKFALPEKNFRKSIILKIRSVCFK